MNYEEFFQIENLNLKMIQIIHFHRNNQIFHRISHWTNFQNNLLMDLLQQTNTNYFILIKEITYCKISLIFLRRNSQKLIFVYFQSYSFFNRG